MLISDIEKPDIYSIRHFGILGMHRGQRKTESSTVATARKNVELAKANTNKSYTEISRMIKRGDG